jgi:nicotinamidase-related amidase
MAMAFEAARTAVLSMDCQAAIVSLYVKEDQQGFLHRVASVLRKARAAGMAVIHVRVGFRPNLPEIGARNLLFSALKSSPQHRQIFEGSQGAIHPALAPEGDDIVITKHRISAFAGTDLQMILRVKEIDTLVLLGIATSGVVLSTLLVAVDEDYRLAVIRDCCVDQDAELNSCLLEKLFPLRATVISAADFLSDAA